MGVCASYPSVIASASPRVARGSTLGYCLPSLLGSLLFKKVADVIACGAQRDQATQKTKALCTRWRDVFLPYSHTLTTLPTWASVITNQKPELLPDRLLL